MKGFTFIELMVSVSIVAILSVSGTVYLNKMNGQQKLDKAKEEIESAIKLTQNYAKVKQRPTNYTNEVRFTRFQKAASGKIEADVNGVGETYFSKIILNNGISTTFNPIYFWGGTGKQVSADGTFFGANENSQIVLTLNEDVAQTRVIVIDSFGGVE